MNSGSGIYEAAFKAFFNLHQLVNCHIHYVNITYDLNLDILHMFTILHMCSTICSTLYVQYVELCMCWKLQKKLCTFIRVYICMCTWLSC